MYILLRARHGCAACVFAALRTCMACLSSSIWIALPPRCQTFSEVDRCKWLAAAITDATSKDRQAANISPPPSLSYSHTLSPWHKMICHSEQEYALQGSRWHQFISTGLIQNIVSPSGRKQIKQTRGQMESEREKGRKREQRGKTVRLLLATSLIRWTDTHRTKVRFKKKKPENHHLRAAAETGRRCPLCNLHAPRAANPSLAAFVSEQPFLPQVLLQLWLSVRLQFISHSNALFFLHRKKKPLCSNCLSCSPWSPLCSPFQLFPPCGAKHVLYIIIYDWRHTWGTFIWNICIFMWFYCPFFFFFSLHGSRSPSPCLDVQWSRLVESVPVALQTASCAHYLKHVWLAWARLEEEWIRLLDCEHAATYL